jgi:dephospho-CoA kinase
MLVVGLTGSIGMGKSTAARYFRDQGIAVFDADAEVHRLYQGPLSAKIEAAFPGTVQDGAVDRQALASALMKAPERFKDLEAIVHPAVRRSEQDFLQAEADRGAALAVLEIPLLYESGADGLVDAVVVVSADAAEQRRRVLERPGMTAEKLEQMLRRQLPDAEKRRRADFVVDTGGPIETSRKQLDSILADLKSIKGNAFERFWR